MDEPLRHISESAATTVTISKVATPSTAVASYAAMKLGESELALIGLFFTIVFGLLGLLVNWYFRHKENKRRDEEHAMHKAEHEATMARLTAK